MTWEELYGSVVREVDGKKMPDMIAAARQAIQERSIALNSEDHAERDRLEQALRALAMLETESRNWSSR